jgi:hypothetical protein
MDIGGIEEVIVERVGGKLPNLQVLPFPDDPRNYKMDHPIGAVLVNYHGSHYREPVDTEGLAQPRDAEWDLTIQVRNLRSHQGAYPVLEAIRQALQGWGKRVIGAKFRMGADEFVDAVHGIWTYRVVVKHELMAVADPDQEAPVAIVSKITMQSADGEQFDIGGSSANG